METGVWYGFIIIYEKDHLATHYQLNVKLAVKLQDTLHMYYIKPNFVVSFHYYVNCCHVKNLDFGDILNLKVQYNNKKSRFCR